MSKLAEMLIFKHGKDNITITTLDRPVVQVSTGLEVIALVSIKGQKGTKERVIARHMIDHPSLPFNQARTSARLADKVRAAFPKHKHLMIDSVSRGQYDVGAIIYFTALVSDPDFVQGATEAVREATAAKDEMKRLERQIKELDEKRHAASNRYYYAAF